MGNRRTKKEKNIMLLLLVIGTIVWAYGWVSIFI